MCAFVPLFLRLQSLRSFFLDLVSNKGNKKIDFLFSERNLDGLKPAQRRKSVKVVKMMRSSCCCHVPMHITLNILRAAMKREGVPLTTTDLRVLFDVLSTRKESMSQIERAERIGVTLAEAQAGCDRFFKRRRMKNLFKRIVNAIKHSNKKARATRGGLEYAERMLLQSQQEYASESPVGKSLEHALAQIRTSIGALPPPRFSR
jgi:hypothetical protein